MLTVMSFLPLFGSLRFFELVEGKVLITADDLPPAALIYMLGFSVVNDSSIRMMYRESVAFEHA